MVFALSEIPQQAAAEVSAQADVRQHVKRAARPEPELQGTLDAGKFFHRGKALLWRKRV
ncbi:MAG TPA: hypothetical protein VMT94_01475 [Burkholderiales bacterium]|nr:hypothetical protein [Burkholderiales bacterium]